jgi:two-component system sensor histidine kinase RpfC
MEKQHTAAGKSASKSAEALLTAPVAASSGTSQKSLAKRTRVALFSLTVAAVASIALVIWPLWATGRAISEWPVPELLLILFLFAAPLSLLLVWWPRRYKVDQVLAKRPDSEHEQATIRMVLGGVAMLYLSIASFFLDFDAGLQAAENAMAWGLCVGWLALLHIVVSPAQSTIRRAAMAMVDLLTLSYMLAVGGGPASVLFPIYLWVTFGNGFRYGVGFLVFSAGISAIGFSGAVLASHYWLSNEFVAYGLFVSLIVLPAYVSTLIQKLNRARAQAEEASQAKSRFLATMSHELRTPLTAVISTGDLLETTSLDADQRSMVGTVQTSAKALLSLINEILDLSRIEAGKQNLDLDDIDPCAVVSTVWRMLHTQAEQKGLHLRVRLDARLSTEVRGDPKRLMQILVNLVGNAIKFTGEGEVELSAELLERKGNWDLVLFSVRDTGIGVPSEKLGSIFEGFTQADDAINRRYGGTGLGLTITRQLVEMMGGEIEVVSQEGQGSLFNLTIPFERPAPTVSPLDSKPGDEADLMVSPASETASSGNQLPVVVCVTEPRRSMVLGSLDMTAVKIVENIDEAVSAIESYRSRGHVLVAVSAEDGDELSGHLARYLEDRRSNGGIALITVAPGDQPVRAGRTWPLDVVIASPASPEAFATALHQSGLFYSSGISEIGGARGASEQTVADSIGEVAAPPASRRILLVDDNGTNRRVISRVLENAGHSVETAENGDDALDRLDVERFDIVLTDINMPGTSGLDLTKMYRVLHADEPHLPIVALTADATENAKRDCLEAGMNGYLTKPVEAQQLISMVRELTAVADSPDPFFEAGRPLRDSEDDDEKELADVEAGATMKPRQLITPIFSHPRYGSGSDDPILDPDALEALRALDSDQAFMAEVFDEFLNDAEGILADLNEAFDTGDLARFHDEAHALRSSAGYVGAKRIVRLLLDMRGAGPDRGNKRTRDLLAELGYEFERARVAMGHEASPDRRATPR